MEFRLGRDIRRPISPCNDANVQVERVVYSLVRGMALPVHLFFQLLQRINEGPAFIHGIHVGVGVLDMAGHASDRDLEPHYTYLRGQDCGTKGLRYKYRVRVVPSGHACQSTVSAALFLDDRLHGHGRSEPEAGSLHST